jgi:hypothetical protein
MTYVLYWNQRPSGFAASNLDSALILLGEIVGVNGATALTAIRYADGSYTVLATATGHVLDWIIQEEANP